MRKCNSCGSPDARCILDGLEYCHDCISNCTNCKGPFTKKGLVYLTSGNLCQSCYVEKAVVPSTNCHQCGRRTVNRTEYKNGWYCKSCLKCCFVCGQFFTSQAVIVPVNGKDVPMHVQCYEGLQMNLPDWFKVKCDSYVKLDFHVKVVVTLDYPHTDLRFNLHIVHKQGKQHMKFVYDERGADVINPDV